MSPGRLTTHVLDTVSGRPAAGIHIVLSRLHGTDRTILLETHTNADGRCDAPLLSGDGMMAGTYELVFHVGKYFADQGNNLPQPAFLDQVPIRFGISNAAQHYHVPLLVSPFAYSTYRGS